MRALRWVLAGLVGGLSWVVLTAAPSYACSCVGGTAADYADWSDVIVAGTVLHREPPPARVFRSSADPATYTVAVDRVYQGEAAPTTYVLSPDSGASCGLEGVAIGEQYVVFATYQDVRGAPSDGLWATLCGGTAPATSGLVAEVEAVTGAGVVPVSTETRPRPPGALEPPTRATLAGLALPAGLVGGGLLVLLTGWLWLRWARR